MKTRILLILCLAVALSPAQTFEVAAIHPNTSGAIPLIHALPGGTMSATNTSIQTLIRVAYKVGVPQISGPDWMTGFKFDITAKGTPEDVSLTVMAPKIQALLADRFGLVVHQETMQVTALAISGGEHLKPSEGGDGVLHLSKLSAIGKNITMGGLCRGLSDATGDMYVDESGFAGKFDVDIKWARVPEELAALDPNLPPSLNVVLHDKLGVTVKAKKVALPRIVVDRVNKTPTEN